MFIYLSVSNDVKMINISNMLIYVAEILMEVINLKTRLTGNVVPMARKSPGYEFVRGNGGTCLHALLFLALRVCELSDSLSGRLETKNIKKKHPVAAEGCRGTRGDTEALEQENCAVHAEIATALSGLCMSALSRINYTTDTGLKCNVTLVLDTSVTLGAY